MKVLALCFAVGAVVGLDACGDPTGIDAQSETIDTTRTVYALNGTPANLPSALNLRFVSPVRLESGFDFDLAFDIDQSKPGQVIVYTMRAVASQLVPGHRVGLQPTTKTFAEAVEAPTSGYTYDSLLTVPVGQTIFVDVLDPLCPQFSILGQNVRAKFVVESVNTTARSLDVHVLTNPNCGFKQLVPGLPKE